MLKGKKKSTSKIKRTNKAKTDLTQKKKKKNKHTAFLISMFISAPVLYTVAAFSQSFVCIVKHPNILVLLMAVRKTKITPTPTLINCA